MTFNNLIHFIGILIKENFTGEITIYFHKGNVSHKIKKGFMQILEEEK